MGAVDPTRPQYYVFYIPGFGRTPGILFAQSFIECFFHSSDPLCDHDKNIPGWMASLGDYFGLMTALVVTKGNVEKSRQRRSLASHRHGRPFAVLTYYEYAPRVKRAAALLDELF